MLGVTWVEVGSCREVAQLDSSRLYINALLATTASRMYTGKKIH